MSIIAAWLGEEAMLATAEVHGKKFRVRLRDMEADEYVSVGTIYPNLWKALFAAQRNAGIDAERVM